MRSSDEEEEEVYSEGYDSEDEGLLLEGPKYWSHEDESVLKGVMEETEPLLLGPLCGTYLMVWQDGETLEEITPESTWRGTVTIERRKSAQQRDPDPDGFKGKIALGSITGTFLELKAMHADGEEQPNRWDMIELTLDGEHVDFLSMQVTTVMDDSGNCFVNFEVSDSHQSTIWLGKMQTKPGVEEFLTEAERERLGMDLTAAQVKEKANKRKKGSRGAKRKVKGDDEDERPRKKGKK
ncbi:hypothetical protein BKA93DRAFT_156824 [Sparassis latifolia]